MENIEISVDYTRYLDNLKEFIIKFDMLKVEKSSREEKEKHIKILKESYNKMFLYQLYKDKNLIAITGLQGAGKTSLTRDYFDIPKDILPENNSRGEKLPVFITVSDVKEIEAFKYIKVIENDKVSIRQEKIDSENLKEMSMNPDENKDLWLQLVLPIEENKFNDPNTYIVLLPGFERENNDFSQKLLEFIINISKSSIVVIDKNETARKSSTLNLKRIENKFSNLKPIITLTHGDENPEENEEIRKDIIKRLNVTDDKRVIVTGPKGMFSDEWQKDLTSLLTKYSGAQENENEKRQSSMQDLLIEIYSSLEAINYLLEDEARILDIKDYTHELSNSGNIFKNEYEQYLKELEKELLNKMEIVKNNKTEAIIDFIENNNSFLKNIKSKIFGRNLKDEMTFKNEIISIWDGKYDNLSTLSNMNEVAHKQLSKYNDIFTLPESNSDNDVYKNALIKQDNRIQKLKNYFGGSEEIEALNKSDIRGLVYMGANFLTSTFKEMEKPNEASKLLDTVNNYDKGSLSNNKNNEINIQVFNEDESQDGIETGKKLAATIPVILGIDIASDGEANIIEQGVSGAQSISDSLKEINIPISSRAIIALTGISGAAVIASYAVTKNIQDMNKRQFEAYANASFFIDALAQSQVNGYINSLRNVFEVMEQKIIYKHSVLKGEDEQHSNVEKCQYLLNNVTKITEASIEKSQYEELLF